MRALAASGVLFALAACASPMPGVAPGALPPQSATASGSELARATLTIAIPRRRHAPHFVSPATHSIAITIAAKGKTTHVNANLTPSTNPNCKGSPERCTIVLALATGTDTLTFATYDGFLDGSGSPTGNELSARQSVSVKIKRGKQNTIHVALDGLPASVAFVPAANSKLSGNAKFGYTISKCFSTGQSVSVLAADADGNAIIGAGAPAATLSSSDSTHLAVTAKGNGSFTLTRPHLPSANSTVQLTAKVTPPSGIGGTPRTTTVAVTFNGDICGVFTEFKIPTGGSAPRSIAVGPDGALWFTECATSKIGRVTTAGAVTEPGPSPSSGSGPFGISAGPDGNVYFTENTSSHIAQYFFPPGSGLNEQGVGSHPAGITQGPDGKLWFTLNEGNEIATVSTLLGYNHYPVPTASSRPAQIVAGPDGNLWFTECSGTKIGRVDTSGSTFKEFAVPTASSLPYGITVGPDGLIWFTEAAANKVGRIALDGSGVHEFSLPGGTFDSPNTIVAGPDEALWFTKSLGNRIGRITTSGVVTEYPVPTASARPMGIVKGPDDALWFVEQSGNKVGRLQ